jgi:hypothetical protein
MKAALIALVLSSLLVPAVRVQDPYATDGEGFIRNWLVLAPIAIEGESGATEIEKDFLRGEATIKPKAGDEVAVGGAKLAWKAHQAPEYFIDFLVSFGKSRGEYVAGYAAAYVIADEDMGVSLALSTNDQGKAWLNGKEVFTFAETRTLEKDADKIPVSLYKGKNLLVLKVINEVNNWQACARFLNGAVPLRNLRVSLTP